MPVGQAGPDLRLYALVGPARSNSNAIFWNGRGIVFIWLESWLGRGSTNELQDCDTEDLAAAVAHELAHAVRYALPSTRSL